jgi:hypothetical protein
VDSNNNTAAALARIIEDNRRLADLIPPDRERDALLAKVAAPNEETMALLAEITAPDDHLAALLTPSETLPA